MKLLEAVVIPSLLHNIEAQQNVAESVYTQLEKMQLQMLTESLEVPRTTPYYPLLMETGFWQMKARVPYRRLMLFHNIMNSDEKRVAKKVVEEQMKMNRKTTWFSTIQHEIEKYNITLDPLVSLKSVWKNMLNSK